MVELLFKTILDGLLLDTREDIKFYNLILLCLIGYKYYIHVYEKKVKKSMYIEIIDTSITHQQLLLVTSWHLHS